MNDRDSIISVYDAQDLEGYQIKETAKGALIISPSKVIVTTPGSENRKEI